MDDLRRDQTQKLAFDLIESGDFGGDSACWAHLFTEELDIPSPESAIAPAPLDVLRLAEAFQGRGPASSLRSEDLDLNLLVFRRGEGVAEHLNSTVDVLIVAVLGDGLVTIDGQAHSLTAGQLVLVPKGTRRSTAAVSERFSYLSIHRRRPGLMPTATRPDQR